MKQISDRVKNRLFIFSIAGNLINGVIWLPFHLLGKLDIMVNSIYVYMTGSWTVFFIFAFLFMLSAGETNEKILKSSLCDKCRMIYEMYEDDNL